MEEAAGAGGAPLLDGISLRPLDSDAIDFGLEKVDAEVQRFVEGNAVDTESARDLRDCPPEVQRIVLSRGDLSSARNPSAALIARIRDARASAALTPDNCRPGVNVDLEAFFRNNEVDESAAAALRGCSAAVQRIVLARGELRGARNPSSALLSRIREAKNHESKPGCLPGSGVMRPVHCGQPPMGPYAAPWLYPGYFGMGHYGVNPYAVYAQQQAHASQLGPYGMRLAAAALSAARSSGGNLALTLHGERRRLPSTSRSGSGQASSRSLSRGRGSRHKRHRWRSSSSRPGRRRR